MRLLVHVSAEDTAKEVGNRVIVSCDSVESKVTSNLFLNALRW